MLYSISKLCVLFHCLNQGVSCLMFFPTSFSEKTKEGTERRKTFVEQPLCSWYLRHIILLLSMLVGGEGSGW